MIGKWGPAAFEARCIPMDTGLLGLEAYKGFLQRRRALIAERINQFLAPPGAGS